MKNSVLEALDGVFTSRQIPIILCIAGLIFHIILYSVLQKKFNFGLNVFLYGVGFAASCVNILFHIFAILQDSWGMVQTIFYYYYILPFTLLFYSYATLLQNKEKDINKVTLFLMTATVVSFAALMLINIIELGILHLMLGIPMIFFGYIFYSSIHKKYVLNLREFAWCSFLLSWTAL